MRNVLLMLILSILVPASLVAQERTVFPGKTGFLECKLIRTTLPLSQMMDKEPLIVSISEMEEVRNRSIRRNTGDYNEDSLYSAYRVNGKTGTVIAGRTGLPDNANSTAAINQQFPGIPFTLVDPSDNNIAAGPNHVVQVVNGLFGSYFQIWDKFGNVLVNRTALNTITGHQGYGDPVVLYDQFADRFLLCELGQSGNHTYICVSQTNNPAGAYYVYDVENPELPFEPKLATWGDSYVLTVLENTPAVYALDRTKMLAGNSVTVIPRFTIPGYAALNRNAIAPVDISGNTVASSGSPALIMRMADDGWGAGITDRLEIFSLQIDWVNPSNTALTGPVFLPTLPFSTNLCGYTSTACIPQQGTSIRLDPAREYLMNKVSYRNFNTYESIVCTHIEELGGNSHAGIRWYELRRTPPAANWVIYQQGTYGLPSDPLHRWMPCIAINGEGSIGLAYNISGTNLFPSIRFTGRKVCDPLGQMTEPEQTAFTGLGFNADNDWGHFNSMIVDPINGSFWFTANYGQSGAWRTQITNFSIASTCGGCSPVITAQPVSSTVCAGNNTDFTVSATGFPLTYQWQVSTVGPVGPWTDVSNGGIYNGAATPALSITGALQSMHAYQYRCIVTGTCAPAIAVSNPAVLTVNTGAIITSQPVNSTVCEGGSTSFYVNVTGASFTYQWQVSTNGGGSYTNLANTAPYADVTTATMNITSCTAGLNGHLYRCNISNQCSPLNSASASLTVNTAPAITAQPQGNILCTGTISSLSLSAAGTGLSYQWQSAPDCTGPFADISGATSASLNIIATTTRAYRCIVTGSCAPAAISNCAILTVINPVTITTQPQSTTACVGDNTSFTAGGTGTNLIYQWQLSIDGGATWTDISGAVNATYSISSIAAGMNNNRYRCAISNATCPAPAITNVAVLTVNSPALILVHPLSVTVCSGSSNSFCVTATGDNLSYQWETSASGCAGTWTTVSGATSACIPVSGTSTASYRCKVSSIACGNTVISNCAVYTVASPVAVTTQPADKDICSGANVVFGVTASGATVINYQWQVSNDGGLNWNNIINGGIYSGTANASLTLTAASILLNSTHYRCLMITPGCATPAISSSAVLTVRPLPAVGLTVAPLTALLPGQTTTLTASPSPAAGGVLTTNWLFNTQPVVNSGNTRMVNVEQAGNYQVRIQEAWPGGLVCSGQSPVIPITAAASTELFIFPSPNDGRFTLSYYNTTGSSLQRKIIIYGQGGNMVYSRDVLVTGAYTLVNIDLQRISTGIYYVVLLDTDNKKLASGKVHIR